MLSVSTMALAAMIGSACVPNANQACNVNSCTYDQANCIQAECAANGGQDLNCLLNGLAPMQLVSEVPVKFDTSALQETGRALDFAISNVTKEK